MSEVLDTLDQGRPITLKLVFSEIGKPMLADRSEPCQ